MWTLYNFLLKEPSHRHQRNPQKRGAKFQVCLSLIRFSMIEDTTATIITSCVNNSTTHNSTHYEHCHIEGNELLCFILRHRAGTKLEDIGGLEDITGVGGTGIDIPEHAPKS